MQLSLPYEKKGLTAGLHLDQGADDSRRGHRGGQHLARKLYSGD